MSKDVTPEEVEAFRLYVEQHIGLSLANLSAAIARLPLGYLHDKPARQEARRAQLIESKERLFTHLRVLRSLTEVRDEQV